MLIFLEDFIPELKPTPLDQERLYMIIPKTEGFHVGIVASHLQESTEGELRMEPPPIPYSAVLGISLIRDRVTYVLDLFTLCEKVSPQKFERPKSKRMKKKFKNLLVVEDTPFFRSLEKAYFESAGYTVTLANDGQEAFEWLVAHPTSADLVVSDIEMPRMNGYDLVKKMRDTDSLKHLPAVALTSLADDKSARLAQEAGFDAFAKKADKDQILRSVLDLEV